MKRPKDWISREKLRILVRMRREALHNRDQAAVDKIDARRFRIMRKITGLRP